jgi:hypothetical protein
VKNKSLGAVALALSLAAACERASSTRAERAAAGLDTSVSPPFKTAYEGTIHPAEVLAARDLSASEMIAALDRGGRDQLLTVMVLATRTQAAPNLDCGVPYVEVEPTEPAVGRRMLQLGLFDVGSPVGHVSLHAAPAFGDDLPELAPKVLALLEAPNPSRMPFWRAAYPIPRELAALGPSAAPLAPLLRE